MLCDLVFCPRTFRWRSLLSVQRISFAVWIWPDCCHACRSTEKFICAAIGKRARDQANVHAHAYTHNMCVHACVLSMYFFSRFITFIRFDAHHIRIQRTPNVYTLDTVTKYQNSQLWYSTTKYLTLFHYARDSLPKINIKATACGVFVGFCHFFFYFFCFLLNFFPSQSFFCQKKSIFVRVT